jgi:hypothetical protein
VRARFGARLSFAAFGQPASRTDHVISFANAGLVFPTCPTGAPHCVTDDNGVVNRVPQRSTHSGRHRYRAEDSRGYVLGIEAHLAF